MNATEATKRCEKCKGTGERECDMGHEHECDGCNGRGWYSARDAWSWQAPAGEALPPALRHYFADDFQPLSAYEVRRRCAEAYPANVRAPSEVT